MVAQLLGSMGKKFTSSFDRLVIMLMPIIEYINFEEMSTMNWCQYTKVLNAVFAKATSFQGWLNLYSPSYDDVSKAEAKLNIDNIKITTEEVAEANLYNMDGIKVTTGEVKAGLVVKGVGYNCLVITCVIMPSIIPNGSNPHITSIISRVLGIPEIGG